MDKSLKSKAVSIKGKSYVQVSDRVVFFNENYPNGSITTKLITEPTSEIIVIKATVIPDCDKPERKFIDYAQEKVGDGYINKTSAMENCSTSAVGRALAYMGIGVIESIASVDEITKAENRAKQDKPVRTLDDEKNPTKAEIKKLADELEPLLSTAEEYRKFIKEKTGLELSTDNYQEIINKLKILNGERE